MSTIFSIKILSFSILLTRRERKDKRRRDEGGRIKRRKDEEGRIKEGRMREK